MNPPPHPLRGWCVDVCPRNIVPVLMMKVAMMNDAECFEKLNGMECVECAEAARLICPAKLLTQAFKEMRKVVAGNRRKK